MDDTLRVEFGEPEHGWIKVTLTSQAQALEFDASYLCDSISDLARMVSHLVDGYPEGEVTLTEETDAFDFCFTAREDQTTLRVFQYPEGPPFTRAKDGKVVFEITQDRLEMALAFWRALRRLQTVSDYSEKWRHEFPAACVERISTRIGQSKRK